MKKKKPYCIVAQDAGSANQLSCWGSLNKKYINFSVNGPAKKIFRKTLGNFKNLNFKSAVDSSKVVICGTGGAEFEKKAMLYAKNKKKRLIVLLDHWIFYRRRLNYKNKKIIPDEIWVTDRYAFIIANKIFKCKIVLKPDYYFRHYLKKKKLNKKNIKKIVFLYLLGRIDDGGYKNSKFEKIEKNAFKNFLNLLGRVNKKYKIIVRLHPSVNKKSLNKTFLNKNFYYSKRKNLLEDINSSNYVFGGNSASMYYALRLNKKVICCIPNLKYFVLPFKNIIKLKNFINRI